MNVGMLWFDDAQRTLEAKVQAAATYYEGKYGISPNLCVVHPITFGSRDSPSFAGEVEIRPNRSILPDHFWIGVEEVVTKDSSSMSGRVTTVQQLSFMEEQL